MRALTRFAALGAALFALPATAQTLCDPDLDSAVCPPDEVLKYCPVVLDGSCTSGKGQLVISHAEPPPPQFTEIVCNYDAVNSGYFCEAWPKRGDVSYSWDAHGDVWFTSPRYADYAEVRCLPGGNEIRVVVTSPYGLSTQAATRINCSYLIDP